MADKQPFYVTTAISYPNGEPPIGRAYEVLAFVGRGLDDPSISRTTWDEKTAPGRTIEVPRAVAPDTIAE